MKRCSRLQGPDLKCRAEMREWLVRNSLKSLHIVKASEYHFEASFRSRHCVSQYVHNRESVSRVSIEKIVGLVQQHEHNTLCVLGYSVANMVDKRSGF